MRQKLGGWGGLEKGSLLGAGGGKKGGGEGHKFAKKMREHTLDRGA